MADLTTAKGILTELVACKDLKEEIERIECDMRIGDKTAFAIRQEYESRKTFAWDAARRLIGRNNG